jgi:ribosomal 50S subunit-recycling heat shock protein
MYVLKCVFLPLYKSLFIAQRYALDSGVTTINGKVARPDTVVRNGDRIE